MTTHSERILGAFKPGERLRLLDICHRTELPYPTVSIRMAGLVETGHVFRLSHGIYALEKSDEPLMATKKQQILAAFKEHPACTTRHVRWRTKLPTQLVAMYTHHLTAEGLLQRVRRGVYRAVEPKKGGVQDPFAD